MARTDQLGSAIPSATGSQTRQGCQQLDSNAGSESRSGTTVSPSISNGSPEFCKTSRRLSQSERPFPAACRRCRAWAQGHLPSGLVPTPTSLRRWHNRCPRRAPKVIFIISHSHLIAKSSARSVANASLSSGAAGTAGFSLERSHPRSPQGASVCCPCTQKLPGPEGCTVVLGRRTICTAFSF